MRNTAICWVLCLSCAQLPGEGTDAEHRAATVPEGDAVAAPVPVPLPFPAGHRIRVLSGYGPRAGSRLHHGIQEQAKGNDYYALDLQYADAPDGGLGLPVLSPFPGVVVRAGWASAGWRNFGQRVILRHRLPDGKIYHSMYAHLDGIDVAPGERVEAGAVIGRIGQSCVDEGGRQHHRCWFFAQADRNVHLHFAIHQESRVGGSGSGGSFGGRAVVPEPFGQSVGLRAGDIVRSYTAPRDCQDAACRVGRPCEGWADGAHCVGDRSVRCAGGRLVDERHCADGCSGAGACGCPSGRAGGIQDGDCVQVEFASACHDAPCGFWGCADGEWLCLEADADLACVGAVHRHSSCAAPTPPPAPAAAGCYSRTLGREIQSGDCVQVANRVSCNEGACGWWSCEAGGWACVNQGAHGRACEGIAYPAPECMHAPSTARTPGSGACFSRRLGFEVADGACVQGELTHCDAPGCAWSRCTDGAFHCALGSECTERFGAAGCGPSENAP